MSVAEEVNLDKQQLLDLRLEQYYVPDPVDLGDEYIRNIQKQVSEIFIKDRNPNWKYNCVDNDRQRGEMTVLNNDKNNTDI